MSGVQTENTSDAGGGKNVGYIDNGDWMNYSVNASSAGTYTVNLRVSTPNSGAQLQIKNSGGAILATVNVPTTWGFQNWQTVSASVNLPAGTQTIRIQSSSQAAWNFNWMEFVQGGSTTSPTPTSPTAGSTRIEAENWSGMSGVQTENTSDAGGGKDVGWIENGDWMNYSYNAPSSGTYTMSFRLATIYSGAQFQVKNSSGQVLATVNVPTTGGFQTWQTVSATVNLPAGQQTIKLQSTSSAGWNINWIEISGGGSTYSTVQRSSAIMSTETTNVSTAPALEVYPNPVTDRFVLQVNNSLSGAVNVQIVNLQGAVQKQFTLSKDAAGTSQFYLSIGDLPAASYIIKVTMNGWNDSTQIIKQ
jgi:endoglucanase